MFQSMGLNLKDVVRLLLGGVLSLGGVNASHGVTVKASADGRSRKFAIAIAQGQRAKSVWRSKFSSEMLQDSGA